ncbi:MAG: hypothetical protein IJ705_04360 [Oscillospiraceae bacterium]|nr:hypothetical protein [Oscillospiraceae bacterium]
MTEPILKKELTITASQCDHTMRLGVPQSFELCMDLAGEHAEALGNGIVSMMERGLFWVAVKTRLRLFRRPGILETVQAETWPEAPGRLRGDRDYVLRSGGETLLAAKTEWTILNTESGGLWSPREGIYAPEMKFCAERCCPEPYHRFTEQEGWAPFADYTVRSTDIDMGGHMNNAAYVRMLAGLFSTQERSARELREAEVHYRASCYEGETLRIERRDVGGALEMRASVEERLVLLARFI